MSALRPLNDGEVYYCKSCHSLLIIIDETLSDDNWDGSYCGRCHSSDIGICTFETWQEEEERRKAKRRQIEWSK